MTAFPLRTLISMGCHEFRVNVLGTDSYMLILLNLVIFPLSFAAELINYFQVTT